jgi:hypothetical protein
MPPLIGDGERRGQEIGCDLRLPDANVEVGQ